MLGLGLNSKRKSLQLAAGCSGTLLLLALSLKAVIQNWGEKVRNVFTICDVDFPFSGQLLLPVEPRNLHSEDIPVP